MKCFIIGLFILLFVSVGVIFFVRNMPVRDLVVSPLGKIVQKPLEKYTINNLSQRSYTPVQIIFDETTATTAAYTVRNFHYRSDGLTATGVAHVPNSVSPVNKKPVIVQFRGYVDQTQYTPGEGTQHSAEVFAQNGFITLAPDFLGYGGSDKPSTNVFEERFQTYTAALNLLASVSTIPFADAGRVGIWGHSNGGQIALTVLEIIGKPIPTVLWAPVSKPFPYSILYYTDEADDHGKMLRRVLAEFEKDYDVELYSLTNYLDRITGVLQIHQGSADEAVPQKWSDDLVAVLKANEKDLPAGGAGISYFVYTGADHNMTGVWNTVVARDVQFFRKTLLQ